MKNIFYCFDLSRVIAFVFASLIASIVCIVRGNGGIFLKAARAELV